MYAQFNRFEIQMTLAQARSVSGQGQQIENVRALLAVPAIARQFRTCAGSWIDNVYRLTPDNIRAELNEYGAWDDAELSDDDANRERIVWLAGCNIAEEQDTLKVSK